ncbi:hypothetical protein [Desulfobaculum bizertense]|uniref:Uncharacterized protein n=1 Tax=Desulfobaculum bizertense DSM 18034 TaxID=1121442 RepID=A0A1T4VQX2_9BACT|nr:hypothetical protein [Desulfobaculum bizertense]SKA67356.1 hypothetical protein SAMN02745702_00808 [Desulfobaculum bizertense DSM 18034]
MQFFLKDVEKAKAYFLEGEGPFLSLKQVVRDARCATVQRARFYCPSEQRDREMLWQTARDFVSELKEKYARGGVQEEEHIETLCAFQRTIEKSHRAVLADGTLRFGSAQKFVNLSLKLLWVVGEIEEPPHAPIDNVIAHALGSEYKWTKSTSRSEYSAVVQKCREIASMYAMSPAVWELHYWNAWSFFTHPIKISDIEK